MFVSANTIIYITNSSNQWLIRIPNDIQLEEGVCFKHGNCVCWRPDEAIEESNPRRCHYVDINRSNTWGTFPGNKQARLATYEETQVFKKLFPTTVFNTLEYEAY